MKVIAGAGNSLSECTDAQSLGGTRRRRRRKPEWGVSEGEHAGQDGASVQALGEGCSDHCLVRAGGALF